MSEYKQENHSSSRTIYINPNFKKQIVQQQHHISTAAHINPLFLGICRPPAIHMNPDFLNSRLPNRCKFQQNHEIRNLNGKHTDSEETSSTGQQLETIDLTIETLPSEGLIANKSPDQLFSIGNATQKIISKSRTKIVREPAKILKAPVTSPAPLIRLSSRKLVRRSNVPPAVKISPSVAPVSCISTIGKYKLVRKDRMSSDVAKNKVITPGIKLKRKTFVARYALQRSNFDSKCASSSSKLRSLPVNKKLQMLNINGVLYRSTRNKLQRKDANVPLKPLGPSEMPALSTKSNALKNNTEKSSKISYGRVLFVRGTKFVLDKNGFKLTRVTPTSNDSMAGLEKSGSTTIRSRQRIDIGGLTYVASTTQNVFVRTSNHLALAHLNTAKNRSLQLLTRRLVKSNIPCAIFQRIGKCIAHERGKCNKVHDKRQVTICPRFLRSECHNSNCLLSHNVSLAKMPVCKFFLQGVCVRTDCPYLHKKLSVNADVCTDFLRGYCKLAEQCNKRHEFVCPEYERNGNCEVVNCIYCKSRKRKLLNEQTTIGKSNSVQKATEKANAALGSTENSTLQHRYFIDKDTNVAITDDVIELHKADKMEQADAQSEQDSDDDMPSVSARPKVGALPSFIPLL